MDDSSNIFYSLFCQRAKVQADGKTRDDGHFFVDRGVILVNRVTRFVNVYEFDEWEKDANNAPVVLGMDLDLVKCQCRRFNSIGGNYKGGRIRFFGTFNRGYEEALTFKMNLDNYTACRDMLVSLIQK